MVGGSANRASFACGKRCGEDACLFGKACGFQGGQLVCRVLPVAVRIVCLRLRSRHGSPCFREVFLQGRQFVVKIQGIVVLPGCFLFPCDCLRLRFAACLETLIALSCNRFRRCRCCLFLLGGCKCFGCFSGVCFRLLLPCPKILQLLESCETFGCLLVFLLASFNCGFRTLFFYCSIRKPFDFHGGFVLNAPRRFHLGLERLQVCVCFGSVLCLLCCVLGELIGPVEQAEFFSDEGCFLFQRFHQRLGGFRFLAFCLELGQIKFESGFFGAVCLEVVFCGFEGLRSGDLAG